MTNWPDVEMWLYYNSPTFNKASSVARYNRMSETGRLQLIISLMAIQNEAIMATLIRQAEHNVTQIILPPGTKFPLPPLWKRIVNLIRTGDWI